MKFNVHGGHNKYVPGASKHLDEVTEDRKVKNELATMLKDMGHTVYDCTDDSGKTQNQNLKNIVAKCNAHTVDWDLSIHLNSGGGTGVEVLYYSDTAKSVATRISEKISKELGIKNRGVKKRTDLYVLKKTNAKAILVECCFVDSQTDKSKWNVNKCAKAIAEGLLNKDIVAPQPKPPVSNAKVNVYYRVRTQKHGWLTEIKNLEDYAGYQDSPITDVAIRVDKGSVKYRVHVKGGNWLGWITGCDINNSSKYAGNHKAIDAIQVYFYTPDSIRPYKRAHYKTNYGWQYDTETKNKQDGYAGLFGHSVTKLQLEII